MTKLVYLICSLPSLKFAEVPPISLEDFQQDARKQLPASQFSRLDMINIRKIGEKAGKGDIEKIKCMLADMKQDLGEIRTAKSEQRKADPARMGIRTGQGNPLEREREIMEWQWNELENIAAGKTFTFTELVVYKLKLQILYRMHSFNTEEGAGVLATVVNRKVREEEQ